MNAKEGSSEDYVIYANEIIKSVVKETEQQFHLICTGSGGRMPYNIEELEVAFITYKLGNIEDARYLIVEITEKFLDKINNDEKIRPFLKEHPFKPNRAQVSIAFCRNDGSRATDGSVVHAFQVKNIIYYEAENPITRKRYDLFKESYEDAEKIVHIDQLTPVAKINQKFRFNKI